MRKNRPRFSFIGPGRAGTSIALALSASGWKCDTVVHGKATGHEIRLLASHFRGASLVDSVDQLRDSFDVLIVAVNDDAIPVVFSRLARVETLDWNRRTVLHLSGTVDTDCMSQLVSRGAMCGALHPIAPFPKRFDKEKARKIYYDFYGMPSILPVARRMVRDLHSRLLILKSKEERIRLHIASVIVSNFVTILFRNAEDLVSGFLGTKDSRKILHSLLSTAGGNLLSSRGLEALSGPLIRGDADVIMKHLDVLKGNEDLLRLYTSASMLGLNNLLKSARSPELDNAYERVRRLLQAEGPEPKLK